MWVSDTVKKTFEERKDKFLKAILTKDFEFIKIGVFGSYARDEYNGMSDIDFCIIVNKLPSRDIKGWIYDEAEINKCDVIFVLEDNFNNSNTRFMNNLRRDFKEVLVNEFK